MNESAAERTVSVKQAMAIVGVSRRTIYLWMKSGKLRFKRTAGGSARIYEASLWQSEKVQSVDILDTSRRSS